MGSAHVGTPLMAYWDSEVDTTVCPQFARRFYRCLSDQLTRRRAPGPAAVPSLQGDTGLLAAVYLQAIELLIGGNTLDLE